MDAAWSRRTYHRAPRPNVLEPRIVDRILQFVASPVLLFDVASLLPRGCLSSGLDALLELSNAQPDTHLWPVLRLSANAYEPALRPALRDALFFVGQCSIDASANPEQWADVLWPSTQLHIANIKTPLPPTLAFLTKHKQQLQSVEVHDVEARGQQSSVVSLLKSSDSLRRVSIYWYGNAKQLNAFCKAVLDNAGVVDVRLINGETPAIELDDSFADVCDDIPLPTPATNSLFSMIRKSRLRALALNGLTFDETKHKAFQKLMMSNHGLESLELVRCHDIVPSSFHTFLFSQTLRVLRVTSASLMREDCFSAAQGSNVHTLDLSEQNMDEYGMLRPTLHGVARMKHLQRLRLSRVGLHDEAIGWVVRALLPTRVRELDLSGNEIARADIKYFARTLPQWRALEVLNLSGNPICDDGASQLFAALPYALPAFQRLQLFENFLGDRAVMALASALPYLQHMAEIDVSYCGLRIDHVKALIVALSRARRRVRLNVFNSRWSDDEIAQVCAMARSARLMATYRTHANVPSSRQKHRSKKHETYARLDIF
ncbi:hypothetical protein SPRG_13177 [Saprolegnia parasitica CBS 223.65]|uniref:Uncharacterized protein n=1 Tax=Saprolegnia parasitica (strain CBS 223.65) TaxID=695850 RepID=A0A067BU38_SAPPC|nr:hypothetical protein SPRG_13177 [Saprolegnia parasitica CBS 223.65]KDO21763.1 hypothetical protein SPRG_13177 [Saprolegnia parasitica CBS 223.65]|eukprot:XP_012207563.1 hypothetical protein SPRG_13177 [Saprolegnia parasitica CBS 223.65]